MHDFPQQPSAPAAPSEPEPQAEAQPTFGWDGEHGPTLHGVPVYALENPYGGIGLGLLVGLDLDAVHESDLFVEQNARANAGAEPVARSGGAAHYYDLVSGKGWTVALNPDGA